MRHQPILSKLETMLDGIRNDSLSFVRSLETTEGEYYGIRMSFFESLSKDQELARMKVFRRYENLHSHMMMLLGNAPESIQNEYNSVSSSFRAQVNLETGFLGAEKEALPKIAYMT